jgi:hypothetical protein
MNQSAALDADGNGVKANEAERRIIAKVRKMGNKLLPGWAQSLIEKQDSTVQTGKKHVRAGQKNALVSPQTASLYACRATWGAE